MFGFIGKFKTEVYAGFELVKQRLVTLEAKVESLFEHAKATAATDVDAVKADAAKAETVATDAAATVEAAKE